MIIFDLSTDKKSILVYKNSILIGQIERMRNPLNKKSICWIFFERNGSATADINIRRLREHIKEKNNES